MSSEFFNSIGLGGVDTGYIITALAALTLISWILYIINIIKVSKLHSKYRIFMQGEDGKSLEKQVKELIDLNRELKNQTTENSADIRQLYKQAEYAFQKCGIVKYDAYNQMGGKLSYSLVLLNEKNDGFIINSIHSSEGCYSYTKEIKGGKCDITLGKEEETALNMAMET